MLRCCLLQTLAQGYPWDPGTTVGALVTMGDHEASNRKELVEDQLGDGINAVNCEEVTMRVLASHCGLTRDEVGTVVGPPPTCRLIGRQSLLQCPVRFDLDKINLPWGRCINAPESVG
jgi:hypothetical protein